MEADKILELGEKSLEHHVRAFESTSGALNATIFFGIAACSAILAFSVKSFEQGHSVTGGAALMWAVYLGVVAGFHALREYRAFELPSLGTKPENILNSPAKDYDRQKLLKSEAMRVQSKIDKYKEINGDRGRSFNILVKSLLFSPAVYLLTALVGFWLRLAD